MKFNLKNRPKPSGLSLPEMWQFRENMDAWFENFENELREKIKPTWVDEKTLKLIKEILG